MGFYSNAGNRFVLLIEQLRFSVLSGAGIEQSVKYFSKIFDEFAFLKKVSEKIDEGSDLKAALEQQTKEEISPSIKEFLQALNSGDFASQKLEELEVKVLKDKKENFENVSSSLTSRLGWLAVFAIMPVAVYFVSSLAEVFRSTGFSELAIPDSAKLIVVIVCALLFLGVIFSKRLKNG